MVAYLIAHIGIYFRTQLYNSNKEIPLLLFLGGAKRQNVLLGFFHKLQKAMMDGTQKTIRLVMEFIWVRLSQIVFLYDLMIFILFKIID